MEYVSALVFPFIILLVENFLPYPHIIEEVFKFFLAKYANTTKVAIILGLLFSISEAIFYLLNPEYSIVGGIGKSATRFLLVTPMHITTILVMQYFARKTNLWPIGLILAILIHYLFNSVGSN
ncbi:MAG: hypothetical protein QY322_04290 [bacterium]|nr:MAG: hypothetical protein QY322_04290 [bacterium]